MPLDLGLNFLGDDDRFKNPFSPSDSAWQLQEMGCIVRTTRATVFLPLTELIFAGEIPNITTTGSAWSQSHPWTACRRTRSTWPWGSSPSTRSRGGCSQALPKTLSRSLPFGSAWEIQVLLNNQSQAVEGSLPALSSGRLQNLSQVMPHPWKYSRSSWMRLGATCSGGRCPCSLQRVGPDGF